MRPVPNSILMATLPVALAILPASPASGKTAVLKTSAGAIVHWMRPEITVGIAANAASRTVTAQDVLQAVQQAAEIWNRVPFGQPHFRLVERPGADVRIKFCRGKWRGDTLDLGNAEFTATPETGVVTSAIVEFNECDHSFAAPDEAGHSGYDLQAVVTHELGHVLGLGHSDNPATLMYPNGGTLSARGPHADDKMALALVYFGRDSTGTSTEAAARRESPPAMELLIAGDPSPRLTQPTKVDNSTASNRASSRATALTQADLVSVLTLKTSGGRQVMVYTREPTLLPPITAAPPGRGTGREHRTRSNRR
jgi:predicted Zn-dependent protease